jgi:integrase
MEAVQTTPKVRRDEIQVLDDNELATLLKHLKGRPIYMPVLMAASTGMRRGEVLALRWKDIDLDRAALQVAQVVKQTKAGISLKEPKTERCRRTIALPARLVAELRRHRKELAEFRLRLGLGKDERDLAFPTWDGALRSPRPFSKELLGRPESATSRSTACGIPTSRTFCAAAFLSMSCRRGPVTRTRPLR